MARLIIGLTGKMGAGKSIAAGVLTHYTLGFTRVRFAGALKDMMKVMGLTDEHVDGKLKELPCELLGGKTPRYAMQTIGTDWGRDMISPTLWVDVWKAKVRSLDPTQNVVVDDVRFPNEAATLKEMGGLLVRIHRDTAHTTSTHASETMDFDADINIYNDSTIEDLRSEMRGLVGFLNLVNHTEKP